MEVKDKTGGIVAPETHQVTRAVNRGRFLKPCPGTPRHVCCGYHVIHFAQGCTLGCTYCILNKYFDLDRPVLFTNTADLFAELERAIHGSPVDCTTDDGYPGGCSPDCGVPGTGIQRYGTGEFADSLLFEELLPLHAGLVRFFARQDRAVLEIKTKTTGSDGLLDAPEKDNVIMAWSLNSQPAALREEPGAPSPAERIVAARRAQDAGYRLAFHFDPLILHPGWEEAYPGIIDLLFSVVDPRRVVYISMGTVRFMPEMREQLHKNGAGFLCSGEFVRGEDNKMRYFRPLRTEMYRRIRRSLERHVDPDILYLCMERTEVWEDVFGEESMSSHRLARRLDAACLRLFPKLAPNKSPPGGG